MRYIQLLLAFLISFYNEIYYFISGLRIYLINKKDMSNHMRILLKNRYMFNGYFKRGPKGRPFSPMAFGLEISEGWDNLIETMLECVKKLDTKRVVQFDQIKEKFGSGRFYHHINNDWLSTFIFNIKILQITKWGQKILKNLSKKREKYIYRIEKTVDAFEHIAGYTCEICGEWGSVKCREGGYWLKALCDKCAKEEKYVEMKEEDLP